MKNALRAVGVNGRCSKERWVHAWAYYRPCVQQQHLDAAEADVERAEEKYERVREREPD